MSYGLADPTPGDPVGTPLAQPGTLCQQVVMNGEPLLRTVTIKDPQGLHMRPAAAFAKRAREFQSTVTLRRDDRAVNGKSQLDLMLLAAEPAMVLEVEGDDAATALPVLADLIEAVMGDGDGDESGPPPKG